MVLNTLKAVGSAIGSTVAKAPIWLHSKYENRTDATGSGAIETFENARGGVNHLIDRTKSAVNRVINIPVDTVEGLTDIASLRPSRIIAGVRKLVAKNLGNVAGFGKDLVLIPLVGALDVAKTSMAAAVTPLRTISGISADTSGTPGQFSQDFNSRFADAA